MDYVAIDYSGSTGNNAKYWDKVIEIVKKYPDANFITWDTSASMQSVKAVLANAEARSGHGGTNPSSFANIIPENVRLTIITDGRVTDSDVTQCDKIIKDKKFKQVDIYLIYTGGEINLSVSTPFTRNTVYNIYIYGNNNECETITGNSAVQIDLDKYRSHPELFLQESETLYKQIVMQNLGRANVALRNKLLDLQKNLLQTIASQNYDKNSFDIIREAIVDGVQSKAIQLIMQQINPDDNSLGKQVETMIQNCVSKCDSKDYSFSSLVPNRLNRAQVTTQVLTEELPNIETIDGKFEDMISFEIESPVCPIVTGKPVLADLDKNYLDFLINTPFALMNNPELVKAIQDRLDPVIGMVTLKKMSESNLGKYIVSPFTRRDITAALCFGDEKLHDKSNKFALANLLFGDKLVGNYNLWLATVYLIVKKVEFLNNPDFIEVFENYLTKKLTHSNMNLTLSGLPIAPMVKAPIDICLWYCVNSPEFVKLLHLDEASNRLRSLGKAVYPVMQLLDLLKYPYNKDYITHRVKVYSVFDFMMNQEKANTKWRTKLRSMYQNSLTLSDGEIILLDGPAVDPVSIPEYNSLDLNELIGLAKLVDRSKTNGVIFIPDTFSNSIPTPVNNYGYPDTLKESDFYGDTVICPKTYRPFMISPLNRKEWKVSAEQKYGPVVKQLSAFNYFIRYVTEFKVYPTNDQFIKFLSDKEAHKESGRRDTLPRYLVMSVKDVFDSYEKVLGTNFSLVTPEKFIEVTTLSMPAITRGDIEKM
jgi:hypothetical protein